MVKKKKSPLVIFSSSCSRCCGGYRVSNSTGVGLSRTGKDECLPELPGSGLPAVTTSQGNDLQSETHSPPVENGVGNQVDTIHTHLVDKEMGHSENVKKCDVTNRCSKAKYMIQVLGYVPIQIANLSLEEVELKKHSEIGVVSPILTESKRNCEICDVRTKKGTL
jgi:hypothetical protein